MKINRQFHETPVREIDLLQVIRDDIKLTLG